MRDAPILILDELTSSIDAETEALIMDQYPLSTAPICADLGTRR